MKDSILKLLEGISDKRLLEAIYWYIEGLLTKRWD